MKWALVALQFMAATVSCPYVLAVDTAASPPVLIAPGLTLPASTPSLPASGVRWLNNQIYSCASSEPFNTSKTVEASEACIGDLALPAAVDSQPLPIVVVVHGGSWSTGSKDDPDVKDMTQMLASKGFGVFAINYRLLSQGGQFPNNIDDVKSAMRFLSANANKFHLDPNRAAVLGVSAGAYLALMAAYTAGDDSERFKAVVAICPATDLARVARPLVEQYLGENLKKKSKVLSKTSPITFAKTGVPTLILHGTADQVIAFEQSSMLEHALNKARIPVELVPFDGIDHGFILRTGEAREQAYRKISDYLLHRLVTPSP